MRVLITGGCGFIGSHLADRLVADGHDVSILDNLSTGRREQIPASAKLVVGDIADAALVESLVGQSEHVFHLAAVASVEQCRREWAISHRTNLTGTIHVLDAAARAGGVPVVYASSAAVYGDNAELPLSELSDVRPLSAYGADKLGCELHGKVAWHTHGVPNVGLRFFNVYGPRQDPASAYSGVISKFIDCALRDAPFPIYGDGEQTRDFIFVGDVVELMVRAASRDANCEILNACTGSVTSITKLAYTIADLAGITARIEKKPPRDGDIRHSQGNPLKAQTILDFTATTTLEAGLATLMERAHA